VFIQYTSNADVGFKAKATRCILIVLAQQEAASVRVNNMAKVEIIGLNSLIKVTAAIHQVVIIAGRINSV
jgi:hypothetical protein